MTRRMGDSTNAADVPNLPMVAGYVSGPYTWTAAEWALHPGAVKVRIATQANVNDGDVLDVERGDATPGEAPGWVAMRKAAGHPAPCIYMNQSTWPACIAAFGGGPQPLWWVANYDDVAAIPPGAIAKQYADSTQTGGHFDLSNVADYWPGVDPPPQPQRGRLLEERMYQLTRPDGHTVDTFLPDVNGDGHQVVVDPGGNPGVPFNTRLPNPPGGWTAFVFAEWAKDGTLSIVGLGKDGNTYYCYLKPGGGPWQGPVKQP